jgi:hypothetical protein
MYRALPLSAVGIEHTRAFPVGSRTFRRDGIDADKLLDENDRHLADKWGREAANGSGVARQPLPSPYAHLRCCVKCSSIDGDICNAYGMQPSFCA